MKHGKRPNRQQKLIFTKYGLSPNKWLVVKNLNEELEIAHRETGRLKKLSKAVI